MIKKLMNENKVKKEDILIGRDRTVSSYKAIKEIPIVRRAYPNTISSEIISEMPVQDVEIKLIEYLINHPNSKYTNYLSGYYRPEEKEMNYKQEEMEL
mgnify:CR=1 FL=1